MSKVVSNIKEAIKSSGLKDGMRNFISSSLKKW